MEKYREGTLSDAELEELNGLTHRDEVMAAAGNQARGIIRRRRTLAFTVAGLLMAGGAVWTLLPSDRQAEPLLAEATMPEVVVNAPEPTVEQAAPAMPMEEKVVAKVTRRAAAAPSQVKPADAVVTPEESDEPVVMCNNQCEADSVINDIWKFLTV